MLSDATRFRLREIRAHPFVNWTMRTPFRAAQRLGLTLRPTLTQHLVMHGRLELAVPHGRRLRMFSAGHQVENNLYWHGLDGHEPASVLEWLRRSRDSHTILDIGANTGLYALLAAAVSPPGAIVHAFEPVPRIADLLRTNVSLNPDLGIRIWPCAVGERAGRSPIYDPGGSNAYSASLEPEFLLGRQRETYEVPVVSVDQLRGEGRLGEVDLIKLDVEGHEAPALRGMATTLSECRPVLLVEYLGYDRALGAVLSDLLETGYQMFWMLEEGHIPKQAPEPPPAGAINVLLLPPGSS